MKLKVKIKSTREQRIDTALANAGRIAKIYHRHVIPRTVVQFPRSRITVRVS